MPITFSSPRAQPEVVFFWFWMKAHTFLLSNLKFRLQTPCSLGDMAGSVKLIGIPINDFLCIYLIASSPGLHTLFCLWRVNKKLPQGETSQNTFQRSRSISWKCKIHMVKWAHPPLRCIYKHFISFIIFILNLGKSILGVPDTGTWVLDNTRPFLHPSIMSYWITLACSKEREHHIFRQYWYTRNVPVFTDTGTFQYLGPEVYFFLNLL